MRSPSTSRTAFRFLGFGTRQAFELTPGRTSPTLAKAYGLVLDPWQENVLQAAMGERADGQWATPRVGVSVPRQNGKGALIEARELAGLLAFGEQVIVHSAHEQKTARVGFQRIVSYFENYDDLRKRVKSIISALNREEIVLKSGQRLLFPARSKGSLRGFSADCLFLDEGQILGDAAWQAIQPTISARPNPQTWFFGTPPTPLDDSTVFSRMRARRARGQGPPPLLVRVVRPTAPTSTTPVVGAGEPRSRHPHLTRSHRRRA
jgi:phage terminase large subunit-like protein